MTKTNFRSNDFDPALSRKRCKAFRRRILDMSQQVTALHIAPAFSCLEIVDTLYYGLMRRESNASQSEFFDCFIMSKGHGCLAQYVVLEDLQVLAREDLDAYCTPDGRLGAHPDYGVPGIAASTGSLGHGLGMAVGMAYAEKIKKSDRVIYVVLSDGEMQEGSTWEALSMAANLNLSNLVAVLDLNDFQGLGRTSETHPHFYPVTEKCEAFGWETTKINGHDAAAIYAAVKERTYTKPFFLIADTIKGKGVAYMESVPIWHYRAPSPEEYESAVRDLKEIDS
jgi:transketolase